MTKIAYNIIYKLIRVLVSTKLALILMLGLSVLTIVGAASSEVAKMFGSRLFMAVAAGLGINLSSCTLRQMILAIKRTRRFSAQQHQAVSRNSFWQIALLLCGAWGSPVFHLGLVLVFVGGMVTSTTQSTDGVYLIENASAVLENTPVDHTVEIGLLDLKLELSPTGTLHNLKADLSLKTGSELTKGSITAKMKFQSGLLHMTFHQYGWTPKVIVSRKGSEQQADIMLQTIEAEDGIFRYRSEVAVPLQGSEAVRLGLEFLPDTVGYSASSLNSTSNTTTDSITDSTTVAQTASKSKIPRNPRLAVYIPTSDSDMKHEAQLLAQNETVNIDDYTVKFVDYQPWIAIKVVRDPGYPVVLSGLVIVVVGLSILLIGKLRHKGC